MDTEMDRQRQTPGTPKACCWLNCNQASWLEYDKIGVVAKCPQRTTGMPSFWRMNECTGPVTKRGEDAEREGGRECWVWCWADSGVLLRPPTRLGDNISLARRVRSTSDVPRHRDWPGKMEAGDARVLVPRAGREQHDLLFCKFVYK